jgi:hypothetical protein
MIQLELTPEEVVTLRETLESVVSDLRYEINNTDAHDYRADLKLKLKLIERVVGQLGQG